MNYNFVVIEGNIGAGKTTLATKISEQFNARLILEQFADNPFLPKFYKDKERYSFPLEMSFLADRYHQLSRELANQELFKDFTLADYYFMKSLIFSKNTLPPDEYNLYRKIFNIIYDSLPKPDLYVYLHLSVDNLLKNIKTRGRDYEKDISADYLQSIQDAYFSFFRQKPDYRFLIIDRNNVDFLECESDYDAILKAIFETQYPKGLNRIVL